MAETRNRPAKLALLMCDTPVPAVLKHHGTYLDIFRDQLRFSNPRAEFPFELDGYDVVDAQEYPDPDSGYTGILISGSGTYSDGLCDFDFMLNLCSRQLPPHTRTNPGYTSLFPG